MTDNIGGNTAKELQSKIERIERLLEERKGINDDIRDIYAEGKAIGLDTRMMRYVIAQRKLTKADRDEQRALAETYLHALGLL